MDKPLKLFCFGLGYSARYLIKLLKEYDIEVAGTTRTPEKQARLQEAGITTYLLNDDTPLKNAAEILKDATHILISIPPTEEGCPVYNQYNEVIAGLKKLDWLGYLSTTGVYGDHQGDWVNEETPPNPPRKPAQWRLDAEKQWLQANKEDHIHAHIFRLSGIYGLGRSVLERLRRGDAENIVKLGDYISRVHVEDIAQILYASMERPTPGEIYNVSDDLPAPSHEVVEYAAKLINVPCPPPIDYEDAEMSEQGRSYYSVNRRIENEKIKVALDVHLLYPTYKEGLKAIAKEQEVGMLLAHLFAQ